MKYPEYFKVNYEKPILKTCMKDHEEYYEEELEDDGELTFE